MLPVEAAPLHVRGGPTLPVSIDAAFAVLGVGALFVAVVAYVFYLDHWERIVTGGDSR